MLILHDYYNVLVDQIYESTKTKAGITTFNEGYLANQEDKETDEHFANKRLYGTVLTCPENFTDTQVELIDPGAPPPKRFISGEYLQMRANQGYKSKEKSYYYPSTFDNYESITLRDISSKVHIQRGDRVYFDYAVTERENELGEFQGKQMYKVRVDEIRCSVRFKKDILGGGGAKPLMWNEKSVIIPQGGWCLVEPITDSWDDIKTPSGIFKKPAPEAKSLQGIVRHIRKRPDLKAGDKVTFLRFADYTMVVEGVPYYVMQEDDILTKFK
jgi:co-chaperonin GroES (HSP10)